jgi:DNA polymerase III epsilon subunit-like protein
VQLGAVQVKDGKIIKRFNVYTNPESKLSEWSSKKLGRDILDENGNRILDENGKPTTTLVTPEWLAQQKSKDDAVREFIEFIGPNALLGGQNVPFDVEILKRMADDAGVELDIAGTIDSKDLASLLPKYDAEKGIDGPKQLVDKDTGQMRASSSLGPVANFLGFEPANWHSADGDAEDSYNLVSKIIDRAANEDNQDFSLLDFPLMQKRYEERMAEFKAVVSPDSPTTDKQKEALEGFSNSDNPEIAAKAEDALASATTRSEAAESLKELHTLENEAINPVADAVPTHDRLSPPKELKTVDDIFKYSQSKEVSDFVASHFDYKETPENTEAVNLYVGDDEKTLERNKNLREGLDATEVEQLDAWTNSGSVSNPVRVYRGIIASDEVADSYSVGSTVSGKSFMSAAVNRQQALVYQIAREQEGAEGRRITFMIDLDSGVPAGVATMGEIVLPRDTEFEVVSNKTLESGNRAITLKVTAKPTKP